MVEAIRRKLSESSAARWTVLALVSFTMLTGYILSDVMAPLKTLMNAELGWDSGDYSFFTSGYGWFNVFLLMLIFGGMILDKMGPRFTGILSVILMMAGTFIQYWAVTTDFGGAEFSWSIFGKTFTVKDQVMYAALGFATFGVGIELIGITATKIVVHWFRGKAVALALGLNVAAGRIGTAIALSGSFPVAKAFGNSVGAPLMLCLILLVVGLLSFLIYCMMDKRNDREQAALTQESGPEEEFKISDIFKIVRISGFWYITILCVLFYSAVFPFLKFATELMIQKYHVDPEYAGMIPALLPFGNILLTPLFGNIYDRRGYGATIMIIGSVLLTLVHVVFAIPMITASWIAVIAMLLLGAAFSLVPSAMWPSVPKIIPHRMLGTAYSLIFWIQNWGLAGVPLLIGYVLDRYCVTGVQLVDGAEVTSYDYTLPMVIFAGFGVLSIGLSWWLRRDDARKGYGLEKPNLARE